MFYFLINQFPSCSKSLPSILGGLPCFKLQFSLGAKSGRHSKTLVLGQAALIFAPYKWYKCILLYEISLCKLGHISRWNTFLSTPQCCHQLCYGGKCDSIACNATNCTQVAYVRASLLQRGQQHVL